MMCPTCFCGLDDGGVVGVRAIVLKRHREPVEQGLRCCRLRCCRPLLPLGEQRHWWCGIGCGMPRSVPVVAFAVVPFAVVVGVGFQSSPRRWLRAAPLEVAVRVRAAWWAPLEVLPVIQAGGAPLEVLPLWSLCCRCSGPGFGTFGVCPGAFGWRLAVRSWLSMEIAPMCCLWPAVHG